MDDACTIRVVWRIVHGLPCRCEFNKRWQEQSENVGIQQMSNVKLIAACVAALGVAVLATNDALAAQGGNSKLGQRDEELVLQAEQAGKSRLIVLVAAD